jgi:GNAT superfamily N-acetyltransferase
MHVVRATPEQAVLRDHASHDTWGDGLPVHLHVAREARLRAGWWPRGALTTWLLCDDDQVLASCETYRVDARVRDGIVGAFEIASLFTEPALRGRGHASVLLEQLATHLRRDRDAAALALFSDVGSAMYERLGFVARPDWDRTWLADPAATSGVDLFGETELSAIHARLEPPDGAFVIWPSLPQLDWHLDRARTRLAALGRPMVDRCGARVGDDAIVWAVDRDELLVLLLACRSAESVAPLLLSAARAASDAGLSGVRAWETPVPGGWPGFCTRASRVGGLPMCKPLTTAVDPRSWAFVPRAVWV